MKLFTFLAASVLCSSTALAQNFPTFPFKDVDPILVNVVKAKTYAKTYGWTDANLQLHIQGYGSAFIVNDESGILARSTAGASVEGLASVFGHTLLGATARFAADAQNATWSYTGFTASVQSQTDNANANAFVKVGPWTLLNESKSYVGDGVYSPFWGKNFTKHIFDYEQSYPIAWGLFDITLHVGADAGAALLFTGTLDPLVVSGPNIGSKAKMSGAANGWVTGFASASVGALCLSVGLQVDLKLANSGFNGTVTAQNNTVTGSVGLTEQPLALVVKVIYDYCLGSGSWNIWNWASPIYSVNYTL